MVTIDVYSDVICPWCFIGKRRLEKGHRRSRRAGHGPLAPVPTQPGHAARGRQPAGLPDQEVRKLGAVARTGRPGRPRRAQAKGIAFDFDRMARTPNTFDAHRLIWLAGEQGVQDAVVEALFRAYFTDGRDLSDRATLAAVAVEGGLDAKEVNELLAGDRGAAEVRQWEQKGRRLGISGVPFFVINGKVALSGAQPPEMFRAAIEQATAAEVGRGVRARSGDRRAEVLKSLVARRVPRTSGLDARIGTLWCPASGLPQSKTSAWRCPPAPSRLRSPSRRPSRVCRRPAFALPGRSSR